LPGLWHLQFQFKMESFGAFKGETMAKRTFFAIVCAVLSIHATAWGQGSGYALQGPSGGPWAGGPGEGMGASPYQPAGMQSGPLQPEPVPQPAAGGAMMGDPCCVGNQGIPQWEFFGDFLYIRPRNANVAYGVVFNGPPDTPPTAATPIQVAPPGTASIDFHPAWRVGFARALDECNAVVVTYEHYEGENQDSISTDAPYQIRSMVSQPSTWTSNAASDWLTAASDYRMNYDLADVDFRWTFENQNDTRLSLLGGMRYASLKQRLDVDFASVDVQNVHSQVNFEGGGLRIGFDGERRTPHGLVIYGRTTASLVAGSARCAYSQASGISGSLVNTGYSADRVVPIIDAELGTGLSLWNDKLRITAGYSFSGWFNLVRTDQFIKGVQGNDFTGMHDTLTFDGFVGRVELQF
jgi:hypothetical protein